MADRPIIFSAPMVRALLEGRKTQTRRIVRAKGGIAICDGSVVAGPYPYAPGDRLYVREAFIGPYAYEVNKYPPRDWGNKPLWFPADGPVPEASAGQFWNVARPSIHMPRWASRLTLTVTEVRVQRLQDISAYDVQTEGACELACVPPFEEDEAEARAIFRDLWNKLHGAHAWAANPWVVALTFTVQRGNIDQIWGAA